MPNKVTQLKPDIDYWLRIALQVDSIISLVRSSIELEDVERFNRFLMSQEALELFKEDYPRLVTRVRIIENAFKW
ncbi:MAG: hypothetical protein ACTSSF_00150 [Candidatus Heimdallarchaeaceae archaeon]